MNRLVTCPRRLAWPIALALAAILVPMVCSAWGDDFYSSGAPAVSSRARFGSYPPSYYGVPYPTYAYSSGYFAGPTTISSGTPAAPTTSTSYSRGYSSVPITRTYSRGYSSAPTPSSNQASPGSYRTNRFYEPGDGYRYPLYYSPAARMYFYYPVVR